MYMFLSYHFRVRTRDPCTFHPSEPGKLIIVLNGNLRRDPFLQVHPDESEERRGEVNPALIVDGHVHADEALVGEQVGALGSEAERRVDLLQQR